MHCRIILECSRSLYVHEGEQGVAIIVKGELKKKICKAHNFKVTEAQVTSIDEVALDRTGYNRNQKPSNGPTHPNQIVWNPQDKMFAAASNVKTLRSLGLHLAGFGVERQGVCDSTNDRRFGANYGVSARTLLEVFANVRKENTRLTEKELFMGANQLKLYLTENVQAGHWGVDENTFRPRWKDAVHAIASLKDKVIKFDPDTFPTDQIYLFTFDGVNFDVCEPRMHNPGSHWYNHKSHSAGVTYEVAIDIRSNRILWINGPKPGKTPI